MNILTIFAGRKYNLEVLTKYLKLALEQNIIQEVHFWNNTRHPSDDDYIRSISNLKRSSSANGGRYVNIFPNIDNNSFEVKVRAKNDIHFKITNYFTEYEIVLGGWGNTKSVVRENDIQIFELLKEGIANENEFVLFKVFTEDGMLYVNRNNERLFETKVKKTFTIKNVQFKTGHGSVGHIDFETTRNHGFFYMDTCEKSWKNYYHHYDHPTFENDIILKCDDDIVFIDIKKLPNFINFVKNSNYDLVFANTINNGVSAFFQQSIFDLIPSSFMDLEMPPGGLCGSLWADGKKAERLHEYFLNNYKKFIDNETPNSIIPVPTRFSINFFGYKAKNWSKISDCYGDDEYNLTVTFVHQRNFKNVFYSNFVVSHLTFYQQVNTGFDTEKFIKLYHNLFDQLSSEGRLNKD